MGDLRPWELDTCSLHTGNSCDFQSGLKEYKPLSCYLVCLRNKKSLSSVLVPHAKGANWFSKILSRLCKEKQGMVPVTCSGHWVLIAAFRDDGYVPASDALMHIDLEKLMRDPDLRGPCTWKQLQSYRTV